MLSRIMWQRIFWRSHREDTQDETHSSGTPHWVIAAFTLALVVCAVFQTRIMYLQIDIMATDSRRSEQLIKASQDNANAAQKFAESAEKIEAGIRHASETLTRQAELLDRARISSERTFHESLEETRENYRLEHRAWVAIDDYTLTNFNVGQNAEAIMTFSNSGKTPAINVKGTLLPPKPVKQSTSQSEIDAIISNTQKSAPPLSPLPTIGPMGHLTLHPRDSQPLSEANYEMVRSGSYDLYFMGRIEYDDVSMRHQWMTICFKIQYAGNKPDLRYCSAGNETSYKVE